MLKKALSVVAALMFAAVVYAAGVELRADHPDTYVVQKGDTLWDISARFLNSPWYWPEIWQANPQIENPHLIYPGDVLSLVYIDGSPHLVVDPAPRDEPAPDIGPQMRDEGPGEAIPPLPYSAVRGFLSRPRVLDEEDFEGAPYVVGLEENRLRAVEKSLVYVRGTWPDAAPGQRVAIVRPTLKYRDVPDGWLWQRDKRRVEADEWSFSDQWHWGLKEWISSRGDVLGYEVLDIGTATVSSVGDPSTLYVTYADMEIRQGDLILPLEESPYDLNFYPRPPKSVPDNMRVVAFNGAGLTATGPYNVVVLTRGAQDGVEAGEVFSIYQPGDEIEDNVAYPKGSLRELFNPRDKMVRLPEEFIGHVMIFRTFDRVSYGLVMNAVRPVYLGAILHEPTEIP